MNKQQEADLLYAADCISTYKNYGICAALLTRPTHIDDIEEGKLIDPGWRWWWGMASTGKEYYDADNRGARLIGIAMMLTMPPEILRGECYPDFKKSKHGK